MSNKITVSQSRQIVLDILNEYDDSENAKLGIILNNVLAKVDYFEKNEKAFISRLAKGCLEKRIALDYVIDRYAETGNKKIKPVIRNILRMAVYEIIYMRSESYAVCNEAVNLSILKGYKGLSGFVNGVLRHIDRDKDCISWPSKEDNPVWYLNVVYSVPGWIVKYLIKAYGLEKTEKILIGMDNYEGVGIRVNELLSDKEKKQLIENLVNEGCRVESSPYTDYAFRVYGASGIRNLPGFEEGLFTVQDISSVLAIECADIKEGSRVLDMCAAPGGKSMHAALKTGISGSVLSCDISEEKIELIRNNIDRLKCNNVDTMIWDGCVFNPDFEDKFDVVICDAPCSGLGIMGHKPDIRYNVVKENIFSLATIQKEILTNAVKYLKKGGTLIFSTCTVTKEEDMNNREFIINNLGMKPKPLKIKEENKEEEGFNTAEEGYMLLLPGINKSEGFFISGYIK